MQIKEMIIKGGVNLTISKKYDEEKRKAQEKNVATKILDLMRKLRMSNSSTQSRRWVW